MTASLTITAGRPQIRPARREPSPKQNDAPSALRHDLRESLAPARRGSCSGSAGCRPAAVTSRRFRPSSNTRPAGFVTSPNRTRDIAPHPVARVLVRWSTGASCRFSAEWNPLSHEPARNSYYAFLGEDPASFFGTPARVAFRRRNFTNCECGIRRALSSARSIGDTPVAVQRMGKK